MTLAKKYPAITVRIANHFRDIEISAPEIKKLIQAVCARFGSAVPPATRYEISLAIVDDKHIRELNEQFLGRNAATDCLSFDLSDQDASDAGVPNVRVLEIVVNGQMAARQAGRRGRWCGAELALYVTHGLLHQLGFDDASDDAARKMHQAEDEILQQLGYGPVYNTDR